MRHPPEETAIDLPAGGVAVASPKEPRVSRPLEQPSQPQTVTPGREHRADPPLHFVEWGIQRIQ